MLKDIIFNLKNVYSLSNEIFNLSKLILYNVGCYGDLALSGMYCLRSITPMVLCLDTWSPSGLQMSSAGTEYINILKYMFRKFCLFHTLLLFFTVYDIISTIHEKQKGK